MKMVEVIYRDGRGPAQRIADRLKPSCPDYAKRPGDHITANVEETCSPTRTVTTVYNGGSQGQHGGEDNG
jgi:hypothetical protein